MQFLRTAFWVVLVIIIMVFSFANWTPVTINLWGGLQLETKLPVIVIVAFLAGSLPFWVLHKATRWRLRRKLDTAERALAAVTPTAYASTTPATPAVLSDPEPEPEAPPVTAPTITPTGSPPDRL